MSGTNKNSTITNKLRLADSIKQLREVGLKEFPDKPTSLYLKSGELFSTNYNRIVYGNHGPYIEISPSDISIKLTPKFNKNIDINNCKLNCYYIWLYPLNYIDIKVYYQLKTVWNLKYPPRRDDGKKPEYEEDGYADYKIGMFYISPYYIKSQIVKPLF